MDRRHIKRQKVVQQLFAASFPGADPHADQTEKTKHIIEKKDELDSHIMKYAQKYEISKIAKVDTAILRLAAYELIVEKTVPPKVIINEAVELAKEFGGSKSPGFVNAVLGKIYEEHYDHDENTGQESE